MLIVVSVYRDFSNQICAINVSETTKERLSGAINVNRSVIVGHV